MLKVNDSVRTSDGRLGRVVTSPLAHAEGVKIIHTCVVEILVDPLTITARRTTVGRYFVSRLTKIEPKIQTPIARDETPTVALYGCHAVTVTRCGTHTTWSNAQQAREVALRTPGVFGIWRVKHRHMPGRSED